MLAPEHRLTLIDAMTPPAGFSLSEAMGVTFTLDLRALLAAPAAFALATIAADTDSGEELPPIDLLHAVRTYADKLTVFSQAGEMSLPPSPGLRVPRSWRHPGPRASTRCGASQGLGAALRRRRR